LNDTIDLSSLDISNVISVQVDLSPVLFGSGILQIETSTFGVTADAIIGFENILGSALGDNLIGNAANNTIDGGAGNDTIVGGAGNDILIDGLGYDLIHGGDGDDTVKILTPDDEDDFQFFGSPAGFLGGDGITDTSLNDTIDLSSLDVTNVLGVGVNLNPVLFGSGIIQIETSTFGITTDAIIGFENVLGSATNDFIFGNGANNIIEGNGGSDIISADAGNDTIDGGDGNDSLVGGAGHDTIIGGNGDDIMAGDTGNDTYTGDDGNDTFFINLANGDDTITDFEALNDSEDINLSSFNISFGAGMDFIDFADFASQVFNDITSPGNTILDLSVSGVGGNAGDQVTLINVNSSDLGVNDFIF
jgi:Ca2+-binding RTX toxin-like protein